LNTPRHKLDEALALVTQAADRIKISQAGLSRISISADDSAARELAALNAKEQEDFAAYARGEVVDIPNVDSAARANIMARLAQANTQREQVERVTSKLQQDLSRAMADKLAAESSLTPLAVGVLIDEVLPVWIESTKSAITEAHRQSDRITAFSMFATAQAHQAMGTPQEATMFSMAQRIRDAAAIDRATLIDAYAGDNARTELLDMLVSLQRAPAHTQVQS
jgi:hypothetical protein